MNTTYPNKFQSVTNSMSVLKHHLFTDPDTSIIVYGPNSPIYAEHMSMTLWHSFPLSCHMQQLIEEQALVLINTPSVTIYLSIWTTWFILKLMYLDITNYPNR